MPAACGSDLGTGSTESLDEPSKHGRFTWAVIGNTCIPCLLKKDGTKYVSVRMAEMRVLNNFLKYFNSEVFTCVSVSSYRITKAETALLNTINNDHCERAFGSAEFEKERDFIVKLNDLIEYRNFMETCYKKLMRTSSSESKNNRCGFVRINQESVVPFTCKNGVKYLPLFYFEGETDHLRNNSIQVDGWDLAYLKFCCKVQGIRNELFSNDKCEMISLDDIKSYFPEGTIFEDYWPAQALNNARAMNNPNGMYSWVQSPLLSPAPSSTPVSMQSMNGIQPTTQTRNSRRVVTSSAVNSVPSGIQTFAAKTTWPPMPNSGTLMSTSGAYHRLPVQNVSQPVMQNSIQKPNTHVVNTNQMPRMQSSHNMKSSYQYYPSASVNGTLVNGIGHQRPATTNSMQNTYQNTVPNGYPYHNRSAAITQHRPEVVGAVQQSRLPNNQNSLPSANNNSSNNNNNNINNNSTSVIRSLAAVVNGARNRHSSATVNQSVSSNAASKNTSRLGTVRQNDEVIDLLSPPSSPPPSYRPENARSYPPSTKSSSIAGKTNRPLPPLVPIDELTTNAKQSTLFPYTTQIVKHGDANIFTINLKPYAFNELLVPLSDIAGKIFQTDVPDLRCKLQQGLKIKLYKPNKMQLQILKDNNKCSSVDEDVPLILLNDFRSHFAHLSYLHKVERENFSNIEAKRARRS